MRVSYDQNLWTSIFLYAQFRAQQTMQAFQTLTVRLFPTEDRSLPAGYQGYSSPLKGFLYDSGVSGALVINSVSGGGFSAPLTRASGIRIDYTNGRVIVPTALGSNLVLTGTASMCEINHYIAAESEETMLTQSKMFVNPRAVYSLNTTGIAPYVFVTPAVFVNPLHTKNEAFQLGGTVNTKSTITMTVFAESPQQLVAILGFWRDARYQYFPMVNTVDDPLDQWNDFKGGTGYNYLSLVQRFGSAGNLVYIEDVRTARVSDRLKANTQQWIGIVDVECSYLRQSPIGSNIFV